MKNRILMFMAAVFVMVGCEKKIDYTKEFTTLYNETIELHDEAMAKMGAIGNYQSQLTEKLDTVAENNKATYEAAIKQLEEAHHGMMDWMHRLNDAFPYDENRLVGKSDDEIAKMVEKLKPLKAEMKEVQQDMQEAINKAAAVLENE